ncbi:hypothetical protein FXW78_14565 [Rhodococcus opacus]|nr:hypothetical protein [Rhodococcus opacus]
MASVSAPADGVIARRRAAWVVMEQDPAGSVLDTPNLPLQHESQTVRERIDRISTRQSGTKAGRTHTREKRT